MKIPVYRAPLPDPGNVIPVPRHLQHYLVSWCTAELRQYDFGYILRQHFTTKRLQVYFYLYIVNKATRIQPVTGSPVIALTYTIQGNRRMAIKGYGEYQLAENRFNLMYVPTGTHVTYLEPGITESFHLIPDATYLEDIIIDQDELRQLHGLLQAASEDGQPLPSAEGNYRSRHIISHLRQYTGKGTPLLLEIYAAAAQLLSHYFFTAEQYKAREKEYGSPHKDLVDKIRQEVLQYPNVHLHTLAYFARLYNTSESTIRKSFKALYQVPFSDFVQTQCMEKATYLLQHTDKSIKEISYELGYSDRSNFTHAYKQHTGALPGAARKKGKGPEAA